MEDYIVRIYRRKEKNGGLFGVVEEVGIEERRAFRSMEELVRLLIGGKPGKCSKSERSRIAIPMTVGGRDASGEPFTEKTVIEGLSPRGAVFRLKARAAVGDELHLLIEPACCGRTRKARVLRVAMGPKPRIVEVVFR